MVFPSSETLNYLENFENVKSESLYLKLEKFANLNASYCGGFINRTFVLIDVTAKYCEPVIIKGLLFDNLKMIDMLF